MAFLQRRAFGLTLSIIARQTVKATVAFGYSINLQSSVTAVEREFQLAIVYNGQPTERWRAYCTVSNHGMCSRLKPATPGGRCCYFVHRQRFLFEFGRESLPAPMCGDRLLTA
jgi:hypothetical protein